MKTLVVARYEEDVAWTDRVSGWNVMVVQKGRDLPNEGREASSFFWALHRLYADLGEGDLVACVQGDPFAHCDTLHDDLARDYDRWTPLGGWNVECDLDGRPHHPGLPIADSCRRWLKREPPSLIRFVAGAQFVVTGREVRRNSDNFYRLMVGRMSEPHAPWVMERLWGVLFDG